MQIDKFDQIQTSQTGGQPHSDTSPSEVSECSLKYFKIVTWCGALVTALTRLPLMFKVQIPVNVPNCSSRKDENKKDRF